MAGNVGSRFSGCHIRYVNGPSAMEAPMREDVVSDFFYRVIEIYCAAERDLLRDAFECTKGRPPQSDSELDDWLDTDEGKLATMFAPASASMSGLTQMSAMRSSRYLPQA